jgi:hypothetical protein
MASITVGSQPELPVSHTSPEQQQQRRHMHAAYVACHPALSRAACGFKF